MNAAASPWSPQQRRWLQALGYAVYRLGGGDQALLTEAREAPPVHEEEHGRPPWRPEPAEPRPAAPARRAPAAPPPAAMETGPAPRGPATRRPPPVPDRLQLALLRASGLDPADPATRALMETWPVEALRGDPAAKRAFWPQFRALRRRRP